MKKVTSIAAAAAIVALGVSTAFAVGGNSNINQSKHNLARGGSATTSANYTKAGDSEQICIFCHTPHNALKSVPIWNRTSNSGYTLYSSVTMANSKHATDFTSESISLFCMSCHDGSALGGTMVHNQPKDGKPLASAGDSGISANPNADLGKDLSSTHPVNFRVVSAGQGRLDGTSTDLIVNNTNGMGSTKFPLFASAGATGGGDWLECSSCHAVHDDFYNPFLRDTMTGSGLCLGCHNK